MVPSQPTGEERVAEDLVCPRFLFTRCADERVDRWPDLHIGEPGFLEHLLPARTGQPARYSAGPKIDVA